MIERVVLVVKGIFIVRFNSLEIRNNVLEEGIFMFDKKLIIVKFWFVDIDIRNMYVNDVLIWV